MAQQTMGHRSKEFVALYQSIQPDLQKLFMTRDPVFLSTSSAWGVMEGALRNVVKSGKVLNCMSGAFSDKWYDVSQRCGLDAVPLKFEWGQPIEPEAVREALSAGDFDAITLIHNETSTGTMNPLKEIMEVLKDFPQVISIVDTVSSFSVLPIPKDELGIDVLLTGSQKALALPPGLALFSVSEKAMERAKANPGRGYYFDFEEFLKNHEKGMTPSTPAIPHIQGLQVKLQEIMAEGMENRFDRHDRLNKIVHQWAQSKGFELFPKKGYESLSLTCIANNLNLDIALIKKRMQEEHQIVIDGGYGKIKGKTFRLSNMGDETEESIHGLLTCLDTVLESIG